MYQLLCAATVDGEFCEKLLRDPKRAISEGFLNRAFALAPDEVDFVLNTDARDLRDLAARMEDWLMSKSDENGRLMLFWPDDYVSSEMLSTLGLHDRAPARSTVPDWLRCVEILNRT